MFEQFKENVSLARDFTGTLRDGLRSAPAAWRRSTPEKRLWLLVPTLIVVSAVADRFSVPWYHWAAVLVLVVLATRIAMVRKRP